MKLSRYQKLFSKLGNVLLVLCLLALNSGPDSVADALTTQEDNTIAAITSEAPLPGIMKGTPLVGTSTVFLSDSNADSGSAPLINNRILIDFGPYIDGQDPNSGTVLSESQIRQRMQIIAPYSKWIRSFSCGNGLEIIGRLAHEMNLQVAVNAWIGRSDAVNQQQISCLINQANAGYVDLAIVGSEALLRGDVTPDALIGYIDQVRQAIPVSIPVTTADVYTAFLSNPLLVNHIDLIFANIYPFWEGYKVQYGVALLNYYYNQLVTTYPTKTIEISETGWPSCGSNGDATGSLTNEALYFSQAETWAHDKNVTLFYFDGLDESWKAQYEGPQGGCWGIWNKNGVMKYGLSSVFDGTSVPYDLTLPSTCDTNQFSFNFTYVPPYGSYDNIQGQTCGLFHKDYKITLYIKVNGGWWVKPYFNQPTTSINPDGTWSVDYTTGGIDQLATEVRAYLIPTNAVGSCDPISNSCGYQMISTMRPLVDIYIRGLLKGNYPVGSSPSLIMNYPNTLNGPVKIWSSTTGNIITSQRTIYGDSFNELMGYPSDQFTTEYWFPWYDQIYMSTWILVGNPSTTQTSYVDIYIGGVKQGATFSIAPGDNITPTFDGVLDGPVRVVSVTGSGTLTPLKIFASERSTYLSSFNEVMGYPSDQFATEYWFPWYDQIYMNSWVLVGNPNSTQTAYVDIYIGGVKQGDTRSIAPNGNITPQFPGVLDGPVRVVSVTGTGTTTPIDIFASERSTYQGSFSEVMGYPTDQFTTDYWYTWYDNQGMTSWVLVGNPSTTQTAYVDIYIGGVKQGDTRAIAPNGNITPQFAISNGPVRVVSVTGTGTPIPINVFTSERSLYGPSFNEMMGYPADQLTTEYWFTWYDSVYMKTDIYVAKP